MGVQGLVSEDNLTLVDEENISNVLDELIDVTKTRGKNWRQVSLYSIALYQVAWYTFTKMQYFFSFVQ